MPYFSIAILSIPPPHAKTGLVIPRGFVTSGLKIPIPNSSTHFPNLSLYTIVCSDGSVYGKNVGQNFIFVIPIRL